uniref:Uncharacterized protein n=1 Tax=Chromera velia CCMP2878 TaxID=1169474 RepID=A0A0G4G5X8_9ALVE|mmetsp:Transcript_43103/g.84984  ORF Transcript_43103/g.84984 Transcript_43103/m.84984 type:complete len:153 (-) Transcript_43103:98-556(-)|eukprot:Cvel_4217.t1-p1 / transcript=Cvel_4217.t1 / gene=Cvel_4217 / organism=Chromera_velia_CCMP2878 / gene_product=hypothetical protein / transcript_product=hypothetical protein / location=Cvel_scaffold182:47233-47782(+) / protein_length=152 / sequence_SO=supercontig / SO=protein_coding / is_pseudo=false
MATEKPTYEDMVSDSLKGGMENGLQYNAIYWEVQGWSYLPHGGKARRRMNEKAFKDSVKKMTGQALSVHNYPLVFAGDNSYFRKYYGDVEVSELAPLKKKFTFSFSPTASLDPFEAEKTSTRAQGSNAFAQIFKSAYKVDLQHALHATMKSG